MKLYYSPGACSLAPHICLYESGLRFETDRVNMKTKEYSGGDYMKVNPKGGAVPTMTMNNGETLTECAVILQYIADQKPESGLAPKWGTIERFRLMEWLNFVATEMHKGYSPFWNPAIPAEVKEIFKARLTRHFEYLNNHLSKNTFLMGNQFTVADAYLFTVLRWSHYLKLDLAPWPAIIGYMEKVSMRDGVRKALEAEGLLKH